MNFPLRVCAAALGLTLAAAVTAGGGACDGTGGTGGTGGKPQPGCKLADLGDPKQAIQLQVTALGIDNTSVVVNDGDSVPLITPPQGGRVIFIGARATNLSPCSVTLTGALKDPATGAVMLDKRSVNLTPIGNGYGSSADSNISSFANIAVCPNQWSSKDVFDQPYELDLTLTDRTGRSATATLMVTPRCAEPGTLLTECKCSCKQGYVLGSACP